MISSSYKRTVVAVIMAVVVLAGLAIWRFGWFGRVSSDNDKGIPTFEELGRVMAQQTVNVLNGSGNVVVWRLRLGDAETTMFGPAEQSFDATLRQTPGVTVVARVADRYDVNTTGGDPLHQTAVTSAGFLQLLEKYPEADALVMFGAAPQLTARDYGRLPAKRPKIVAVAIMNLPDDELLKKQVVQVLIKPRSGGSFNDSPTKTPASRFEQSFEVLTAPTP